jgi:hypothetical protein
MFYGSTQIRNCATTYLSFRYVSQTARLKKITSNEDSFVSVQHGELYLKPHVRVILAGYIKLPQQHCYTTFNMLYATLYADSDM